jgi:hypothetical protein
LETQKWPDVSSDRRCGRGDDDGGDVFWIEVHGNNQVLAPLVVPEGHRLIAAQDRVLCRVVSAAGDFEAHPTRSDLMRAVVPNCHQDAPIPFTDVTTLKVLSESVVVRGANLVVEDDLNLDSLAPSPFPPPKHEGIAKDGQS